MSRNKRSGCNCFDLLHRFESITGLPHHLNIRIGRQHAGEARARGLLVVNDHASHAGFTASPYGIRKVTVAPPPSRGSSLMEE